MNKSFRGTGVAMITPFDQQGAVDETALGNLVDYIIDGGIDFIVALGTTSEAATLNADEKLLVTRIIKERNAGRVPVVLGMGGNNTAQVLNTIRSTDFTGIDAILSVAPYYNKPNQRGLYAHFIAIADASPVPVIIYNVPGRTSSNILADTTLKLARDHKNIIAVKEASGDMAQIMKILNGKPEGFEVLSGDDALTFPMIMLGAAGVISVVANVEPDRFSTMVKDALNREVDKAKKMHYELLPLIDLLFTDGNPAGVKAAMDIKKLCLNELRLPMVPVADIVYADLINYYK